jgi:hypothetical protein
MTRTFALLALTGCGPIAPAVDSSDYPPEMQANAALFEDRCGRCHSVHRALNAAVNQGRWDAFVKRMSRHPGAAINDPDQRRISAFLEYYHGRRRAQGAGS